MRAPLSRKRRYTDRISLPTPSDTGWTRDRNLLANFPSCVPRFTLHAILQSNGVSELPKLSATIGAVANASGISAGSQTASRLAPFVRTDTRGVRWTVPRASPPRLRSLNSLSPAPTIWRLRLGCRFQRRRPGDEFAAASAPFSMSRRGCVDRAAIWRCLPVTPAQTPSSRLCSGECRGHEQDQRCKRSGAPEGIRTPGPQIRSLVLYPAELRARKTLSDGRVLPRGRGAL